LALKTKGSKVQFVKDILGLVNTQGPSRRFLMVGWDDKTQQVFAPGVGREINGQLGPLAGDFTRRLKGLINSHQS